MAEFLVVLVTAPDAETADRIAQVLLEERLIACANRIVGVRSQYWWEDALEEATEALLLLKTTRDRWERLLVRIGELHPYEVPEVLALPVAFGSAAYLDWVRSETRAQD
ncbi:MAG: divalent cation tolerance protein [Candidatus Poribacteria bacterium]|nr:MAG: divalent cation tolerance protein [Candidatus Poribacteria bacterium]